MQIKFAHIWDALSRIRAVSGSDDAEKMLVNISITEDDPGSGNMVACVTLKAHGTAQPGTYDDFSSPIDKEYTAEIFEESENRVPRLTAQESRDLIRKKPK